MAIDHPKRKRQNTRNALVSASAQVFAEKGVAGATVDDLVSAAGFTRGAFYSNFKTKEEVFSAALADFTEKLVAAMQNGIADLDPESAPEVATRAILDSLRPLGRVWALLEAEGVRQALIDEDVRSVYLGSRDYLRRALISTLVMPDNAAPFAHYTKAMLSELATMLLNAYSEALIRELMTGEDSTDRLVELIGLILTHSAEGVPAAEA